MRRRSWPTALLMLLGGCQNSPWWCDSCADVPPGAMPAPVGTYNGQWQQTQAARADEDFRVFYQYEWLGESSHLSPFGQRHLERLPTRFAAPDGPLIVEASGDEARDQARVQALQASLTRLDPAWAECPVQVGRSDAEPLYGFESARISSGFVGRGGGGGGGGGGQGTGGQGGFGGGIGGAAGFGGGSR